jgi:hypothetical protein
MLLWYEFKTNFTNSWMYLSSTLSSIGMPRPSRPKIPKLRTKSVRIVQDNFQWLNNNSQVMTKYINTFIIIHKTTLH